ncbi:hypothetical protein [Nonomuraea sp. NPDC005650]|uniref:hypothetical protein n=1 Tax=Nonomuraea sp. NPDC005650 TaxID=3157045 RepID=UPI0033AD798E
MSSRMYREGDRVTLTIPGVIARIDPEDPARHHLRYGDQGLVYFRTDDNSIDHVLVATADWPPLPGDVWRDRDRKRWFCQVETDPDRPTIILTSEFAAVYTGEHGLMKAVRNYGTFYLEIPGRVRLEREGGR